MTIALKNFLIMTLLVLISAVTVWGYLRIKGSKAPLHQPLKHAFLDAVLDPFHKAPRPDIVAFHALGDVGLKGTSLERFSQLAEMSESLVFWLDAAPSSDGVMIVDEPRMDDEKPLLLIDVLERLKKHRLILNFQGYRPGVLDIIANAVEPSKAQERALFQSAEDGFLKDLREAQPLWLFGSSQAQVTRLIMLSSIGLESSAPLKGDVFVMEAPTPSLEHPLARLSDVMIAEVHRRGMKIYAGPVAIAQIDELYHRGVDGILTSQPEEYLHLPTVAVAHERRTH